MWLSVFCIVDAVASPVLFDQSATLSGIAVAHSAFNILCTALLLPMSSLLEKLAYKLVPESKQPDKIEELDERLIATPAVALERCNTLAADMAAGAVCSLQDGIKCLFGYTPELAASVKMNEDKTDHYEDVIGSYLVKLSSSQLSERDSKEAAKILKIIGDLERIADHAVNLVDSAEELKNKKLVLSDAASKELEKLSEAINEILSLAYNSFVNNDLSAAVMVEPLEEIIDVMKEEMRTAHIQRLQQGNCSIETGFVWSDILTNLERTSDHCSNIAGCVIDVEQNNMNIHESLRLMKKESSYYKEQYEIYAGKYLQ